MGVEKDENYLELPSHSSFTIPVLDPVYGGREGRELFRVTESFFIYDTGTLIQSMGVEMDENDLELMSHSSFTIPVL